MMPEETETQEVESQEPKTFDEDYVKSLRSEAAKHRKDLRATQAAFEELQTKYKSKEDAEKSELERMTEDKVRLEKELAEKDRMMAETAIHSTVIASASRMNIIDPEAAYRLLDLDSVDPSDPRSVSDALSSLVKSKTYLLKSSTPPTPGTGGPPVSGKKSTDDQWLDMLKGAKR